MALSRVFCGFLASLMIVFTVHSTFAAGYMCQKKYTRCNSGYTLTIPQGKTTLVYNIAQEGNSCTSCTSKPFSCSGGTTNPVTYYSYNITTGATGTTPSSGSITYANNDNFSHKKTITLATNTGFSKSNHYFSGWSANSETYSGGQEYVELNKSSTTFTAIWSSCPTSYPYSAGTGTAITSCYRNCTTGDIANAATVTGTVPYTTASENKSNCKATACNANYYVKNGFCDGNVYSVKLNHTGGTSEEQDTIYQKYGTGWSRTNFGKIIDDVNIPTYAGFTFNGYYTGEGGSGTLVVNNAGTLQTNKAITANGSTIYAKWTPNSYSVTFNRKDPPNASCSGYTLTVTEVYNTHWISGVEEFSDWQIPKCTGYTFNGYKQNDTLVTFTKKNESTYDLNSNTTLLPTDNSTQITLNGDWTAHTFNIQYNENKPTTAVDDNNITNMPQNKSCTYGNNCPTPTVNPKLTGYIFVGWNTNQNATSGLSTFKNLSSVDNANVTVYAIWRPITFTVQYNANKPEIASGNVGNMPENITCTYDMDCNLSGTPTLIGWTFNGWYTTSGADGNLVTNMNNATTTNGATVNVYAHWTQKEYTITFDQTGGSNGTDSTTVTFDADVDDGVTARIVRPTRPGYTFDGYFADGKQYFNENGIYVGDDSHQWREDNDKTLYAAWTICPAGSYCPGTEPREIHSCAALERVPTQLDDESVENPGVKYWSDSDAGAINATDCYRVCKQDNSPIINNPEISNGHGILKCVTGEQNNAGQCIAKHAKSCAYNAVCDDGYEEVYRGTERAYCKPRGYNVTFDNNGGVGLVTLDECTVGTNCVLPGVMADGKAVLSRTGYVFTGWSLSADGSTGILPAGTDLLGDLNPTGNLTFYAIWGLCDLGYFWNGLNGSYGACVACPLDSYQSNETTASGATAACNLCTTGYYTENIASILVTDCKLCPAGAYCTNGLGLKSCPAYPNSDANFAGISELTSQVYTSNIGNAEINGCYFDCPEFDVEYGHATPDMARINHPAECTYTCVSVTGNPGHVVNGRCKEDSCNPEYEMKTDPNTGRQICTECNRANAMSYRAGGNCIIDACVDGYHPDDLRKTCVLNEESCIIENAEIAQKIWDPTTGTMGACMPIECKYGYHIDGNMCVSDFADCKIDNGTGKMEWDAVHNRWGACEVKTCMPGYTDDPYESNEPTKQCGECRNKYGIMGDIAVARYKQGCEIEYCAYQGELYNLEGNECVPICDINGYSDETGEMKWNPVSGKCERTCNEGYMSWDTPLKP